VVDFNWGGAPDNSMNADIFSIRWTGQVQPRYSETYTFTTNTDDGVRLWVNGQQIINDWSDHAPTENAGTIVLNAGQKYDIRMDFYENVGGATAQLFWQSGSQAREIIPQAQLYPGGGPTGYPPVVTSSSSISAAVGAPFSYQITASNSPISFSASGLPAGLAVNSSSGLISGTPMATGTFAVALGASNSVGTGTLSLALTIGTQNTGGNFSTSQFGSANTWGAWSTPFYNWALNDINNSSAPAGIKAQAIQVLDQISADGNVVLNYTTFQTKSYTIGAVTGSASFSKEPDMQSYNIEFTITWPGSSGPGTSYSLTVTNGTGSATGLSTGAVRTITASTPPSGQTFVQWVVDSGLGSLANATSSTTTFTMGAGDATVRATYSGGAGGAELKVHRPYTP
jgi:hypothetical protein